MTRTLRNGGAAIPAPAARAAIVAFVLVALVGCAATGERAAFEAGAALAPALPRPEAAAIPLAGGGVAGASIDMVARVYVPAGTPPFPIVVYSHGRSGEAAIRARALPPPPAEQLRYWLGQGFAVVAPVRPGYGPTGGPDAEAAGGRFDASGTCTREPDFRRATEAGVRAIAATLAWLRSQPWADAGRVILVGQSVGGMVTVASAAAQPQGVVAYVNFAGGGGGNPTLAPGHSCGPQQLGALYAEFGRTTTLPNLWIYAQNDQFWGPDAPVLWHAAFAAGGSPTRFIHAPPVPDGNGHGLSGHSHVLWAPYLDRFLRTVTAIRAAPS